MVVWGKSSTYGEYLVYLCNVKKKEISSYINLNDMKKIVVLLVSALCLPLSMMAQSVEDDLYFVPSKEKQEKAETPVRKATTNQVKSNIYVSPGTKVVVKDSKGNVRDVDEYNRRYDARENDFEVDNDTLYIKEKSQPDLDGEWVNGEFNGTQDDYEYAQRIIRFRNPRFAISASSPLYWDIVYGYNSWDWNVYNDGFYAYAFPTFSNPLWWDWRYNSWGWNSNWGWGWSSPYYSWGYPGYWGGGWYNNWCGGWYGSNWGHHHHYGPSWGWGGGGGGNHWANSTYTNRRSYGVTNRSSYSARRSESSTVRRSSSDFNPGRRSSSTPATGRVVGTRRESSSLRPNTDIRTDASSSRRSTYTRPSSTRDYSNGSANSSTTRRSSSYSPSSSSTSSSSSARRSSSSTYNRSSSSTSSPVSRESSRTYSNSSSSSSSSSSRSYSPSSSSSSSRSSSSGSYSSGSSSSSRSSSSSSSSSGGGGSSSRSGRR